MVENIVEAENGVIYLRLTKGKSACLSEDCSGPWRYMELRDTLNNPKHPEYEDMREWMNMGEDDTRNSIFYRRNRLSTRT